MKTVKKLKSSPAKPKQSQRHKVKQTVRQNRPVHHRVFLHPATVFVLLCLGVGIVNMTYRAHAGQYTVTAKVSAAALTDAATLDAPLDGAIFTTSPISVRGTCPSNSYVVLYRNAAMSGVAICDTNNSYDIQTSLYPNGNILKVQAFNLTDDAGPVTPEITVIYNPPVVVVPTSPGSSAPTSPSSPVTTQPYQPTSGTSSPSGSLPLLTSLYNYQTFTTDKLFEWVVTVAGGSAPYQINTHWGDGTSSLQTVSSAQDVMINHQYSKAGIYMIKVNLTDASGNESMLQLVAIIKDPVSLITATNSLSDGGHRSIFSTGLFILAKNWLILVWGTYATLLLMSVSFWLGEQQKINMLLLPKHAHRRYKKSH